MDGFFKPIAESPTLQGVAVMVTLFTLGFYLIKYGWKSLKFIYNFLSGRQKRAFYSISRPAHRRAMKDYIDVRLIMIGLSIHSSSMAIRLFQLIVVLLGTIYISLSLPEEYNTFRELNSIKKVIAFSLGIVIGTAIASYFIYGIMKPAIAYTVYVRSLRRLVDRDLRENRTKATK